MADSDSLIPDSTPDQLRAAIQRQSVEQSAPNTVQPCSNKLTWIEIRLVDMEGHGVAGERYQITLPDGIVKQGRLDATGRAREEGIIPGTCQVTFPDRDLEAWERV
jgi:hypothetical protein